MKLSRFAPYTIPMQSLNVEKFERGLSSKIKDYLLALKIIKIIDLTDRAVIIEKNLQVEAKEFN